MGTSSNISFSYDNIYNALIELRNFKDIIRSVKKGSFKGYLITTELFDELNSKLDYDELKKNKENFYKKMKEFPIKNFTMQLIQNLGEFEGENYEIVNDKIIQIFFEFKQYYNKDINYIIISENEQQIIFKNLSKIKISLKRKKKSFKFIEQPKYHFKNENTLENEANELKSIRINAEISDTTQNSRIKNDVEEKISKNKNYYTPKGESKINYSLDQNNIPEGGFVDGSIISNENSRYKNSTYIGKKEENIDNNRIYTKENINKTLISNQDNKIENETKLDQSNISKENTDNDELKNLNENINLLLNYEEKIEELINKSLDLEKEFDNYLIINKKWFIKLITIFEKDKNIYENENIQFKQIQEIKNIAHYDDELRQLLKQRKEELENENLFKIEFEYLSSDSRIKYPKDFILVEKKFLKNLNLKINYDINIYKMLIGEGLIFIKNNEDSKIVFVSSINDKFLFTVNMILRFNEEKYLKRDIEKYILNGRGLQNYINQREFDTRDNNIQRNISSKGDNIGDVIILKNITRKNNKKKELSQGEFEESNNDLVVSFELNHYYKNNPYNPYLKAIILSFLNIDLLFNNLKKNEKREVISELFYQIKINFPDKIDKYINKIHQEIDEDVIKSNFKDLIDFILTKIHKELNTKEKNISDYGREDYDEKTAFEEFKNNYFSKNDSIIPKTFYGIKEIKTILSCCNLYIYNFEIFKYIYFDNNSIKKENNLKILLKQLEIKEEENKNLFCKYCHRNADANIRKLLYEGPKILIIIFENMDKTEISFEAKIDIGRNKYNLISCITSDKDNNFNVFQNKDLSWYIFKEDDFKSVGNELGFLTKYPNVLIFSKGEENNNNCSIEIDQEYCNEKSEKPYDHTVLTNSKISSPNKNEKMSKENKYLNSDQDADDIINIKKNNNINKLSQNQENMMEMKNLMNNNMNNAMNNNMNNNMNNAMNNILNNNMNNNIINSLNNNIPMNNMNNIIQMNNNNMMNQMNNNNMMNQNE